MMKRNLCFNRRLAIGIAALVAVACTNSMPLTAAIDFRRALQNLFGRSHSGGGDNTGYLYDKYTNKGCRTSYGGKGSSGYEYDLYYNIHSHDACKKKCDYKGSACYGYEYSWKNNKCEVWKAHIDKHELAYVHGLDCYIKQGGGSAEPSNPPHSTNNNNPSTEFKTYTNKGCRLSNGGKGRSPDQYDVYYNIHSHHACKEKCLYKGNYCYGYEYGSSGRCEIWKVPIRKVSYVHGLNCYIKQSSSPPPPPQTRFEKYSYKGCRTRYGGKGSSGYEYDLYNNISLYKCKEKCIDNGYYCYGYEFQKNPSSWLGYGKCEVWNVLIDKLKLEYVNGLDCYIKVQG